MSTRPEDILAMSRAEQRQAAAEHLAKVRVRNTSEGHALAAIAHGILALTAPEETKP